MSEELQDAEVIYQSINDEMRYELPQLYESRINFLASNFASFFSAEGKFQEESYKIKGDVADLSEKLQRAHHKGAGMFSSNTPSKIRNGTLDDSTSAVDLSRDQISADNSPVLDRHSQSSDSAHASHTSTPVAKPRESLHHYTNEQIERPPSEEQEPANETPRDSQESPDIDEGCYEVVNVRNNRLSGSHTSESRDDVEVHNNPITTTTDVVITSASNGHVITNNDDERRSSVRRGSDVSERKESVAAEEREDAESDEIYRVPASNKPLHDHVPLGANVMYQVQATHMYTGEDTDELSFEPGDTICVVPWEDPDEQDDGWLNGIKESSGDKGVFPANFTKRL